MKKNKHFICPGPFESNYFFVSITRYLICLEKEHQLSKLSNKKISKEKKAKIISKIKALDIKLNKLPIPV